MFWGVSEYFLGGRVAPPIPSVQKKLKFLQNDDLFKAFSANYMIDKCVPI